MSNPQPIWGVPPVVSIIIPVYNRLAYLDSTITSVLNQTYASLELIVVDDGSQEDVEEHMARYDDPRVSLLHQENQGNAAARNSGIGQARGEYIACLDSDDVWHSALLETCVAFLAAHPDMDVVYTQVQAIDGHGQRLPGPVRPSPHSGDLLESLLMGYPILPSSALVRRSCFERWGVYSPGLDDWELWLRWAARGCRFTCIEQPLVHYRIHKRNLNLDWPRRRAAHFAMLDTFYALGDLPEVAHHLRERAYANQHFHFAVLAWQIGRHEDGIAELKQAVLRRPSYLHDLDFYTRIACAHQGRTNAGTAEGLDWEVAEDTLGRSLGAVFADPALPSAVGARRHSALAWAWLALARLAYGVPHDMGRARRYLLRSLAAWPAVLWRTDWAAWMGRALLGYDTVQAVKRRVPIEAIDA